MDNVTRFPTTPQTDPALEPLPVGAPLGLTTNPLDLDGFVLHALELLGQSWTGVTEDRKEEVRQALLLGLWMTDPASRKIVARHILHETHYDIHLAHWRVREFALVHVRLGLDRAMKAVAGMLVSQHRAVVGLAEQDDKDMAAATVKGVMGPQQ